MNERVALPAEAAAKPPLMAWQLDSVDRICDNWDRDRFGIRIGSDRHLDRVSADLRFLETLLPLSRIALSQSVVKQHHLSRFVGPQDVAPLFVGATGKRLRPSNFGVIWQAARRKAGLEQVRFHDLRHFAATMFATTGPSTKDIMSRGGWRSIATVVRQEHASEERDALLAQALNTYANAGNVVPIGIESGSARALGARRP